MLKEHYGVEKIPSNLYRDERKHFFPEPMPYYFQYEGKALNNVLYTVPFDFSFMDWFLKHKAVNL